MGQNLEATVGLEVNADDLLQSLKDIFQQAADMIGGTTVGSSTTSGSDSAVDSSEIKTNKGMFGALKGIMGFVSKIFAGVSVMMAVMKVFEPVINILQAGLKMLAELLRPVSDMLIMLLMPLLSLIKPIVVVMRTLMAPFKQAAQQLSISGMKAIQGGDTENGVGMLLAAAGSMIAPFITIVVMEAAKIVNSLLFTYIKAYVDMGFKLVAAIFPRFAERINMAKADFDAGIDSAKDKVNAVITNMELGLLHTEAEAINKVIDHFKIAAPGYTNNLKEMNTNFEGLMGAEGSIQQTVGDMSDLGDSLDITEPAKNFTGNIDKVVTALNTAVNSVNKSKTIGSGNVHPYHESRREERWERRIDRLNNKLADARSG